MHFIQIKYYTCLWNFGLYFHSVKRDKKFASRSYFFYSVYEAKQLKKFFLFCLISAKYHYILDSYFLINNNAALANNFLLMFFFFISYLGYY